MVAKLLMVIVIWGNDGYMQSIASHVNQCPNRQELTLYQEKLKAEGHFQHWVAWCTTIYFPVKKEEFNL